MRSKSWLSTPGPERVCCPKERPPCPDPERARLRMKVMVVFNESRKNITFSRYGAPGFQTGGQSSLRQCSQPMTSWKLIFRCGILFWMMRNWEEDDLPGRHETATYQRDKQGCLSYGYWRTDIPWSKMMSVGMPCAVIRARSDSNCSSSRPSLSIIAFAAS